MTTPLKTDFPPKHLCDAIILAAGLGTRMRSYNDTLPKPLVPIAGRALIDYSFALTENANLHNIVVNTHYMAEKMAEYLNQKKQYSITISREETLLETGGGIMKVMETLTEPFFSLNSDIICMDSSPPALSRMQHCWNDAEMDALLLLQPVSKAVGYIGQGDFSLTEEGEIIPRRDGEPAYVFTGIQLLSRRFFASAPHDGKPFSLSLLYREAITSGELRMHGIVHDAEWFHVGDPKGVEAVERQLMSHVA